MKSTSPLPRRHEGKSPAGTTRNDSVLYDGLLRRLQLLDDAFASPPYTLGLTSCGRREGVSTVAANLAMVAARTATRPVLLVDANLQHPSVQRAFGLQTSTGFADVMRGDAAPLEAICMSSTGNLHVVPAGAKRSRVRAVFEPGRLRDFLEATQRDFEMVIFDLPPATDLGNLLVSPSMLDGFVLVISAERVPGSVARRVRQELAQVHANVVGVVLNRCRTYVPRWLERRLL